MDDYRTVLAEIWPFYGLIVKTERLEMRVPLEGELVELAKVARVIQPEGEQPYQWPWMYEPSPKMELELFRQCRKNFVHWDRDDWKFELGVFLDGKPIGIQTLLARNFKITKRVEHGAWLGLEYHSQGYGTEARIAMLELVFERMGALEAHSDYLEGNKKSAGVSYKLGFVDNGKEYAEHCGEQVIRHYVTLTREVWQKSMHPSGASITGYEPCLEWMGIAH